MPLLNVFYICTTTFSRSLLFFSVFSYLVYFFLVTFDLIIVSKIVPGSESQFLLYWAFFLPGRLFPRPCHSRILKNIVPLNSTWEMGLPGLCSGQGKAVLLQRALQREKDLGSAHRILILQSGDLLLQDIMSSRTLALPMPPRPFSVTPWRGGGLGPQSDQGTLSYLSSQHMQRSRPRVGFRGIPQPFLVRPHTPASTSHHTGPPRRGWPLLSVVAAAADPMLW